MLLHVQFCTTRKPDLLHVLAVQNAFHLPKIHILVKITLIYYFFQKLNRGLMRRRVETPQWSSRRLAELHHEGKVARELYVRNVLHKKILLNSVFIDQG